MPKSSEMFSPTKDVSLSVIVVSVIIVGCGIFLIRRKSHISGQGYAAPGWRGVADVFREHLNSGDERGGAVAVYYKGDLVVEFQGGSADVEASWKWTDDTLNLVCSCTKIIGATVLSMLVERGHVQYEAKVSEYWPEFAVNEKQDITVEQLVSHQAGLSTMTEQISLYDILDDPERVTRALEKNKPSWTPGTGIGYHGVTFGLYLDELVKKVDPKHRSIAEFYSEEIRKPLDLDFFIGLPRSEFHRTARTYELTIPTVWEFLTATRYWRAMWAYLLQPQSILNRSIAAAKEIDMDGITNHPKYRQIPCVSTHGYSTAKGLGRFYSLLASDGKFQDTQILSKESIRKISEVVSSGEDKVLLRDVDYGRGVVVDKSPLGTTVFGTPGAGGQNAFADPENDLAMAYITNHHSVYAYGDDPKFVALRAATYEALMKIKEKHEL